MERGKVRPGILRLMEVETELKARMKGQPVAEINKEAIWIPPTPDQLRKYKRSMGGVYLGQPK